MTVAYGEKYHKFVPEWVDHVAALQRPADQVAIACDTLPENIVEHATKKLGKKLHIIYSDTKFKHHPQYLVNDAIDRTYTEWICKMDVDDLIYPYALNGVVAEACDVFMFGINLNNQQLLYPQNVKAAHVLQSPHNLVFSGSPFRRWVWSASPFKDMIYEDWAFWREAAKRSAHFKPSNRIDYYYRLHGANISLHCDPVKWERKVKELT